MVDIQEQFLIKNGLGWHAYGKIQTIIATEYLLFMDLPLLIKGCEERKSAEKTVITSKKLQGKLIKCVWAKSISLSLGACIKLSKQHFKGQDSP